MIPYDIQLCYSLLGYEHLLTFERERLSINILQSNIDVHSFLGSVENGAF